MQNNNNNFIHQIEKNPTEKKACGKAKAIQSTC